MVFLIVLLLVLFWSEKFLEMMKNLGKGVRAFNEGFKDSKDTSDKKAATKKSAKK